LEESFKIRLSRVTSSYGHSKLSLVTMTSP
jgi:hypothetical protein